MKTALIYHRGRLLDRVTFTSLQFHHLREAARQSFGCEPFIRVVREKDLQRMPRTGQRFTCLVPVGYPGGEILFGNRVEILRSEEGLDRDVIVEMQVRPPDGPVVAYRTPVVQWNETFLLGVRPEEDGILPPPGSTFRRIA